MSKGYAKQLAELLKAANWQLVRQPRGSHAVWSHESCARPVTIPCNLNDKNMARRIARQAGIEFK